MGFRTVCAIAALLIALEAWGGKASAQYYPPAQAYPPPPQVYYPRQGYRPPVVDDGDADDIIYDLEGRPLLPGASAKQQATQPPGARYGSAGIYHDGRQRDYRDLPQQGDDYEPYYGVPGGISPGAPGSAEQDAILREAMRSRVPPGQVDRGPNDPRVTGSIGGGGDQRNMAAFPPDVQPETGPKKELPSQFRRTLVDYYTKEPAGTIIIDTPNTYLYLVLGNGKALRYGVGVGREGFTWSGVQQVTRMAQWPDWNPPEEMIVRQPYLPRFMAGGETNPLGARALYLGQTIYRIHGTNQPSTIGTFVSSGCIRLTNEDIMDLYSRVKVGTRVVVLPGRPPATTAATSLPPGPPMPSANGSVAGMAPGPYPSAMGR